MINGEKKYNKVLIPVEFNPQGKKDCKMIATLILFQIYLLKNGFTARFNYDDILKETRKLDSFISDWNLDFASLGYLKDEDGINHKYKKSKNLRVNNLLINNIEVLIRKGSGVFFIINNWINGDGEIEGGSRGGHAMVINGYDNDYFYVVNPWGSPKYDTKIKKSLLLQLAGSFKTIK